MIFNQPHYVLAQPDNARLQVLENIITLEKRTKDTVSLKREISANLAAATGKQASEGIRLVGDILLAKAIAADLGKKNSRSDFLFENTIRTINTDNRSDLNVWANIEYGFYLYTYRVIVKATPLFVEAIHNIETYPGKAVLNAVDSFKKLGYFTATLGDNKRAIGYLQRALEYARPGTTEAGDILNVLGRCYFEIREYNTSEQYLKKSLTTSQISGDQIRTAKVYGDLAQIHLVKKEYEAAESYFLKDLALSKEYADPLNTTYALTQLGKLYLEIGKPEAARKVLEEAQQLARSNPYYGRNEYEIVKLLIRISQKLKDPKGEIAGYRRLDSLDSEVSKTDGDAVIQQVSLEAQNEILNLRLQAERVETRQASLERNMVLITAVLLLVIAAFGVISYRRQQKLRLTDYQNILMRLQIEKLTSENKLSETRNTLSAYREYLLEKNNQIEALKLKIDETSKSPISFIESQSGKLRELLQSHLMSETRWVAFKDVFASEEPEYYRHIMEHFPGVRESNLRILFLQRLGLNNSKIASLLGITTDGVKKNKQRMRKKLRELGLEDNLIDLEQEDGKEQSDENEEL